MSFQMMALAHGGDYANSGQYRVAMALAERHNRDTGKCFPSLERIADDCQISVRQVQKHLAALAYAGHVSRQERFIDGRQTTTQYVLHFIQRAVTYGRGEGESHITPEGESQCTPEGEPQCTQNKEVINRKEEPKRICASGDARFDEWYALYPKKKGKQPARKTWKARNLDEIADVIIADTLKRSEVEWDDPTYIPMASTYINQERWHDEITDRKKLNGNQKARPWTGESAVQARERRNREEIEKLDAIIAAS